MPKLEIFYAEDCPHCHKALPIVRQLVGRTDWKYVEFNLKDKASVDEAKKRDVVGVPTIFLDGQEITVDELKKRIMNNEKGRKRV